VIRVLEIPDDKVASEARDSAYILGAVPSAVGAPTVVPSAVGAPAGGLRPPGPVRHWVDLLKPTPEELELIRVRFGLHPLAIEDCAHFGQRPKLEEYRDHLFAVIHRVSCGSESPFSVVGHELHTFLAPAFLITVHDDELSELNQVWERLKAEADLGARGTLFVYYLIADGIVDANFNLMDRISDAIDDVEDAVVKQETTDAMPLLFALKRSLALVRRMLSPQRDVFATLAKGMTSMVDDHITVYFRNLYDHMVRISEAIETNRDLLSNVLDAHLSIVSNRTNEIMKSLTLLSAIFLPLTFVTGFFGQNFQHLPFHSDALMWAAIAGCAALPAGMLLWFRSRRWM